MKKDAFEYGSKQIESRTFYHGSATKIDGDFLEPKEQFNSVQNKRVVGAFVTSDADYAKFFALVKCLSGRGQCKLHGKKIFFERISDSIKPEFNLYTVVEQPDEKFIHDKGTEYYSPTPIKISKRQTCNTVDEIEKLGYEIYVLNEPLKSKPNKQSNDNSHVQSEMHQAIANGAYHRVDVADLIKQQKSKSIFQKLFNWQKD
ncbi:MAG: hypothetical protein IJX89_03660 [Alphaproteobacteria bacterium]|nr:hypothetical protein [Alphaproteobacteria bacterium]